MLDFGGLVDAIFIDSDAIFGLYKITTRNPGPPGTRKLDSHARYKATTFGAWPSITLAPGVKASELPTTLLSFKACIDASSLACSQAGPSKALLAALNKGVLETLQSRYCRILLEE